MSVRGIAFKGRISSHFSNRRCHIQGSLRAGEIDSSPSHHTPAPTSHTPSDAFSDPPRDFLVRSDPMGSPRERSDRRGRVFLWVSKFSCVCTSQTYINTQSPTRLSLLGVGATRGVLHKTSDTGSQGPEKIKPTLHLNLLKHLTLFSFQIRRFSCFSGLVGRTDCGQLPPSANLGNRKSSHSAWTGFEGGDQSYSRGEECLGAQKL